MPFIQRRTVTATEVGKLIDVDINTNADDVDVSSIDISVDFKYKIQEHLNEYKHLFEHNLGLTFHSEITIQKSSNNPLELAYVAKYKIKHGISKTPMQWHVKVEPINRICDLDRLRDSLFITYDLTDKYLHTSWSQHTNLDLLVDDHRTS